MIYHELSHTAVNADVFACDKARLVRAEEQHHICDVERLAYTSAGLLISVGTLIHFSSGLYPPGRDRIDMNFSRKSHSKCVSECRNAALCSGVALSLRLAHSVS